MTIWFKNSTLQGLQWHEYEGYRGCTLIIWTGILIHNPKTITHSVKMQARSQNNESRALKWGIVSLCTSTSMGDMIENKKMLIIEFLHFSLFWLVILPFFYKNAKIENLIFSYILLYHQKYLSYRNVLYVILKLLTNSFDL